MTTRLHEKGSTTKLAEWRQIKKELVERIPEGLLNNDNRPSATQSDGVSLAERIVQNPDLVDITHPEPLFAQLLFEALTYSATPDYGDRPSPAQPTTRERFADLADRLRRGP